MHRDSLNDLGCFLTGGHLNAPNPHRFQKVGKLLGKGMLLPAAIGKQQIQPRHRAGWAFRVRMAQHNHEKEDASGAPGLFKAGAVVNDAFSSI